MAVVAKRVSYDPPDITEDTPVTIRCTATFSGNGNRAAIGSRTVVAEENFIVTTGQSSAIPVGGPNVIYEPVAADRGKTVTIRCTATVRGTGTRAPRGTSKTVSAVESFEVVTLDALVPVLGLIGIDDIEADSGSYPLTIIESTPGQYDEISYEWTLDRFSVGALAPSEDGTEATYTAPRRSPHVDTSYCVIIRIKVMVAGTGTNARADTTDEAEYRFEFEVA